MVHSWDIQTLNNDVWLRRGIYSSLHEWLCAEDVFTRFSKSKGSKSVTWIFNLIGWIIYLNFFFYQYECCPAKARLMWIVKHKVEYLDVSQSFNIGGPIFHNFPPDGHRWSQRPEFICARLTCRSSAALVRSARPPPSPCPPETETPVRWAGTAASSSSAGQRSSDVST